MKYISEERKNCLLAFSDEVLIGAWHCVFRLRSEIGFGGLEGMKLNAFHTKVIRTTKEARVLIEAWAEKGDPDKEAEEKINAIIQRLTNFKKLFHLHWSEFSSINCL